ncbi:hypothetical protein FRC02_005719 [Tulasnella sp. 418]|nr:hypothetical protein FRC02_005719 [Tulasnella sp. 418]
MRRTSGLQLFTHCLRTTTTKPNNPGVTVPKRHPAEPHPPVTSAPSTSIPPGPTPSQPTFQTDMDLVEGTPP